jgi:hypothetical protein
VAVLRREEFDAIEFDAAASGDHQSAAKRMSTLAVTGTQSDSMPRSEAFLRAGEQWLLADDPAAAASGFRLAIADGGPVFVDPRVPLARALIQLGRRTEAYDLIGKLKAEGRSDPRVCDLIAELLVDCSDLPAALEWATAGVELCLRGDRGDGTGSSQPGRQQAGAAAVGQPADGRHGAPAGQPADGQQGAPTGQTAPGPGPDDDTELPMLLRLRYRIRNDLGLAEDSYDRMLDDA